MFLGIIIGIVPLVWIKIFSSGKISSVDGVLEKPVVIVFGAAIWGDSPSHIFEDRLKTSAEIYTEGKVEKILISGGNPTFDHDEPSVGKNFLIKQGIPEEDIVLDYAGFRTYDTCARANKIWDIDSAILVTQEFHLPRSLFLCESFGIDSEGVSADKRVYWGEIRNLVREQAAKIKAFWEVYVFPHDPKFLGKKENLGLEKK